MPPENQETQPAPAPDLMGYKSVDDLVAAKRSSDQEAKRMAQRIQELEQFQQFQQQQQITDRQPRDPYGRLNEWGLPVDDLRQAISQQVAEALQPLTRSVQARNAVIQRKPEFLKHESQVMQWLAENPELNARYQRGLQTDPELAFEWAYNEYGTQKRAEAPAQQSVTDDPAAMALPNAQASNDRTNQSMPDEDAIKKAIAYGQQYGDWNPFFKLRTQGTSVDFQSREKFIDRK